MVVRDREREIGSLHGIRESMLDDEPTGER